MTAGKPQVTRQILFSSGNRWRRSQPGHAVAIAGWAASFHGLAAGQVPDLRELAVRS
jgi:hypothetical protein